MRYVKKPVEVEAMRFTSKTMNQVFNWVRCNKAADHDPKTGLPILKIQTLEGVMTAELGDYVIKEPFATPDRQFYPCKPDIFEQTYELVEK